MKKKSMDWYKQQQRFSVRKYHFGAVSVLLGTALVFGGAQASADEVTAPATPSTESTTATSAETTTASEGAPAVLTASEATPASLTASEASSSTEATSLDKGALQVALSQAKALDLSNKTSETVAILLAQIEHAQTVLNTATSQEELNQAVADLQAAQAQLADKPAQPVAVSPASVATTPAPATSTTGSTLETTTPASTSTSTASTEVAQPATTPVGVTPATPAGSEATSQPSERAASEEAVQPSHGRRSRRDLSAVGVPAAGQSSTVTVTPSNVNSYFSTAGTASYDHSTDIVTLTPGSHQNEGGNLYLNTRIDGDVDFEFKGEANIGLTHSDGSDGIGFALSKSEPGHLGGVGNGLGIVDQKDAIGFKLDNYNNYDDAFPDPLYHGFPVPKDPYPDHDPAHHKTWPGLGVFAKTDANGNVTWLNDPAIATPAQILDIQPNTYYPFSFKYSADSKVLTVNFKDYNWQYNLATYMQDMKARYGDTSFSLMVTASSGSNPNTQAIKFNSFTYTAKEGFSRVVYANQATGNSLAAPSDFTGRKNEVKDVRTTADAASATIVANGYTLVATDTSKAPTYNATNGTVTLTSDNQFITYTYKDTQAPTITHTPDVTTGARNPMAPVVVSFADNSDNELDATGNKVVTTTSSVSGLPTGVSYNPATRTISGTPTTPGTYTPTVTVTDAAGNSTTDTFNFVVTPQSDEFTPVGQGVTVKHNEAPIAENGIANTSTLPTGTGYTWKTPVDTSTPGNKPGTVVVTYPDGTKDEVPVTVTVTPQSDEFAPVGQDVPTKHGETPSASDGISNKGDLPAGTTYDWKTPVDTTTSGDKPGTVVVTYPDGTKDEVPVTVKVKPQSDDYTPVGKDVPAKHGDTPSAASGIANKGDLPTGTTYDWKTPVDTTTPGDKPGTVVVTYPDGTKDEVPVTVKVQPQADDYDPQAQPVSVDHGATPNAEDGIANKGTLPPGTTYDWKTPIDTSTPGTKPGTVVVTYPDGTKDEVPVPVTVGEEAALYTPVGQDVPAKHGETPAASQGIANRGTLPAGTTYDWKTPVDTSTPGDKPATVVVTYPDGSKDEVPVTVKVKPQSDEFTPNGQDVPTKHGETPNAADGIANKGDLPSGTTYDWKTPVDTTTPGDKPGTVVVTYPDGTKDEVPVTVKVKPQSDEFTPTGQDVPAKHGETPNAADGIANKGDLPAGTTYDWKTPVDTTTPGDKPATVVVTYPDGTKDEVPVTVKVKPQSDEFTPTGQDVPAKHGETPNAADGIANKGDLPAGTTYDWKTPVDTTTPGDKPGTVVVTYPDGTKDEVPVTVKVKPQSDEFTPVGKDVPAKHGDTPNAADGISNKGDLPAGTTYDWKTPVDTSTPGDKPGTVVVTYPDGTKDEVPVTVKVQPQTDDYDPQAKPVAVDHGATPNAEDGIANKGDLPAGTTYDWKTPVDTSTPGTKPGTVVVTYPDGTKDEVPVPVTVGEQADLYTPVGQDVPAKHGETPAASQGIANRGTLPAGTTYDWKTPVDTSTPGDKPATVVVTYPDGTKDEVPVTVKVKPQSDEFTPAGQDVPTKHGETPNAADGIANKGDLPADTKYDWKTPVDTSTPGDKPGTVVVTYPDGTKDEVPVTVKVKPQSDEFTPAGQDVPAKHGETPKAEDGIANKGDLPDGTKYDWKTPVDTTTPGDKPGTVVVTYPDGTKDEVPVTVKVKPQSDEFTPNGQDVPAKHGETPKAEDGIANKGDLPDGTKFDWKTPVDTTTPGDKSGTVVVTYPDGTKDEVPVTVKVKPQSDEFTPNGQDVPAKHGETPKAEDGIANKGDLPDGTKYDWKTPVDTTTPGDKPGTVVVTYPDGTKDEVPVTVKVKPQSDEFTPQPKDVSTDHGKTPKAEDGIANKGDLPDGTKYDWKTPVDTTTSGDKPGTVVVTYPDGTKDEIPVTVHVGSQSDLYNPDGQNLNVKQGDQPEASKGIANRGNLPDGTTYDWKTPVDTSTVGDKPATVVVTYPDGSKDEVPVTVKVTEKLHVKTPADKVPVKDPSNLTPDDINKVVENIKKENPGLPDDAKITVNPNGGDTTIETKDGDKVTIPGTDLVRPETDADKNNVKVPADKVPVKDPSNLTDAEKDKVKDNIKKANPDLPNGTKIDVDKDGTATITFPDGSTKVIPGTDLVRPETDADKNNVKVPADKVPVKDPSNLTDAEKDKVKDNIKKANPDLPNGTKIDVVKDGTATITFPDGSTKVIPGSDLVRPETDADKNNVKVPADKVPVKDPSNLTDAEKDKVKDNIKKANPDLPNGTKIDVAKDGTATITFPDGSTKVIPGSDLVRPETDADRHTPKGQDVPVKQGETPKAEDGIANKGDLPNGTKIEWKETPDTSKVGDHNATIVITYPDGSKDEVTVTVKVSPNANNNGHNGNKGSHGNGNSGSHNNGTNGDQGQGNKDKKDQAGKDTNNGLDKLFSNSGNGSASGDQSGASRKQAPALPNTGDASNPAMALAFAALLGGTALAMKKRKKEEEE